MTDSNTVKQQIPGLTKREYFAALTMQAMIRAWDDLVTDGIEPDEIAVRSVKLADALIAELAK
jgi:hypothetical protein